MGKTNSHTFHIYYRNLRTFTHIFPRDHIIKDGEPLCDYGVKVPDLDSLKPFDEISKSEWSLILGKHSNLCDECARGLDYYDVVPDDLPDEPPEFNCLVCEKTPSNVEFRIHVALLHHKDEDRSKHSETETHEVPRELYDVWRQNPDKPFSYSKLKDFIDENRDAYG